MPPDNLDNFQLANGTSVRMTKPLEEWDVRYDGTHDTTFDLHYEALMPPVHTTEIGTDDGHRSPIRYGHLDQTMAVSGTVRVRGKDYLVDFPSNRDHSWSPRPEGASRGYGGSLATNFDVGHFGKDFTFFVQTFNERENPSIGIVTNGYILDHGEISRIKAGQGRYTLDTRWVTTALEYELEDIRGRTYTFRGEAVSWYDKFFHAGTLGVVRWTTDGGDVGWGEYNWHWHHIEMRRWGEPPGLESTASNTSV
jgi:hypothetical protein